MGILFKQLFESESCTYTYLLADEKTREAVLIDPVDEKMGRDIKLLQELNLKLKWILDTHAHADHITAAGKLRDATGAKTAIGETAGVKCVDVPLKDGATLTFGEHVIEALATPGHTAACMSYYIEGRVFTGDALMIRGNGRTDFQGGSAERLFHSIKDKLYALPATTQVYPGHDYQGFTVSTIAEERQHNLRISEKVTLAEFVKTMDELKLALPKKIHIALPANLECGKTA